MHRCSFVPDNTINNTTVLPSLEMIELKNITS